MPSKTGKNIGHQKVERNHPSTFHVIVLVFDLFSLETKVRKWIDSQFAGSKPNATSIYRIINLLFKLFVESGATLHKLDLYFSDYEINPEIFYSLGRNEQFFSLLQDLSLDLKPGFTTETVTTLLRIITKNATKLSTLKLKGFYPYDEPDLFHALICIIKSQEQLRQFSLIGGDEFPMEFHGVVSALESQKKSLQEILIKFCYCNTEFEVLMNCKNLEILSIEYCNHENILEASINTLKVNRWRIDASSIVQILLKSGTLLQRLSLVSEDDPIQEEPLLLETLKSFCPNITYLSIDGVRFSTQFQDLIGNLQKLQFLTLWDDDEILTDEQVMQFAKLLPLTLQYLDLNYSCLESYIDILLSNCYAPLKYLLVNRLCDEKKAKALAEFCIRNKSLNYVAVCVDLDDNIKKKVEEYVTLMPYDHAVVNC
ncbi:hypothetical protein F8M41_001448 [Gigaspora margarita]|uniref:Uncharacterized protein n=1 Tax=Gigaspora margarita TaxID=4874 RepID=A0A8H4AZ22_GIGMA|nr:hypothetical protein F8M41_001448 [Gigaspora margarita]